MKVLRVSQRIQAIVRMLDCDTLADIGTDHGHAPIHALQTGRVKRAIACDINRGPLERAAANIQAHGLEQLIDTRLGGGLSPIRPGEADGALLSGLGGMLIIDILGEGSSQISAMSQLVLSPQSDVPLVRRFVHSIGFYIANETMVQDSGKFYHIIDCRKGAEPAYTDMEYALGKRLIDKRDAVFSRYIQKEAAMLESARRGILLNAAGSPQARARLAAIEALLFFYSNSQRTDDDYESHM